MTHDASGIPATALQLRFQKVRLPDTPIRAAHNLAPRVVLSTRICKRGRNS